MNEEDKLNPDLSDEPNQATLQFKCSDVVARNCDWQVQGNSVEELMLQVEKHSREKHGLNLDDETRSGVHHALHKRAA